MIKNKNVKKRLYIFLLVLFITTSSTYILLYVLSKYISFFYTTTEALSINIPSNKIIRVSGTVIPNSVISKNNEVNFLISDTKNDMEVKYKGTLPPIFRDNIQVVIKGIVNHNGKNKYVQAEQVLGKHDERYIPKKKETGNV